MGASVVNTVSKFDTSYITTDRQSLNITSLRDLGKRAYHWTGNTGFEGGLYLLLQKLFEINVLLEEGVFLDLFSTIDTETPCRVAIKKAR